jgi:enoyl-CoA hydratase/carnithine racemase
VTDFEEYKDAFSTLRLEREGGVLSVTCHTDGGPLMWSAAAHREWPEAFRRIGSDQDNRVVVLTGTGDSFSGPAATPAGRPRLRPADWDVTRRHAIGMVDALLSIEVPIVAAINGPAVRHAEVALLSDIVLASRGTIIRDTAHFTNGVVPGDGIYIALSLMMGVNRARYFLLTGQELTAEEALAVGLVSEVLAEEHLLERAYELARQIASRPPLVARYTRMLMTSHIRRAVKQAAEYGLALEALGIADEWATDARSRPVG